MIYLSQIRCFQVRCISLHRVHTAIQMMLSVFSTFAFILRRQKRGNYHLSFSTEFSSRFHIINIAESNMKIIWLFISPSKKSSYQMLANKSGNIITPAWYRLACSAGVLLGRVSVTTLRPPFQTAMLDGGGWGRGHPSPILPLAYHSPPW